MTPNHCTIARTFTLDGVHARPATIEVDVRPGLPCFTIVGLGDQAVRETRERVTAAIVNSGYEMPAERIVVNIAPAHVRRTSSSYDLPIAYAILTATGQVAAEPSGWALWGDLQLSGDLRPVHGALAAAEGAVRAGLAGLIVASANAAEAQLANGLAVYGAGTLHEVDLLVGESSRTSADVPARDHASPELADIRGNAGAIRAALVAAAGGHHLLLTGPAGSGKTMLARRVPGILPVLAHADALEVTRIHGVAGTLNGGGVMARPVFRAPHHSISQAALVGGGAVPRLGEMTMAHRGVLYVDEADQFSRAAMDALTHAVNDREVTLRRSDRCTRLPCDVLLIASVGDCPCARRRADCRCTPLDLVRHRRGVHDRVGDVVQIAAAMDALSADAAAAAPVMTSEEAMAAVRAARERQAARAAETGVALNGRLPEPVQARRAARSTLTDLDPRARDRALRVARTIADLDVSKLVTDDHLEEAIAMTDIVGAIAGKAR